jgi:GTPase Era involved in 16S rRNA processing
MSNYTDITNNPDVFFEREKIVLEDLKKEKETDIINDASELYHHFNRLYKELMDRQNKTNVLITGVTGAGKSSLINTIFNKKLAVTGSGVPITKHFIKYSSETLTINIYDSKGLEHGNTEEFINTTQDFLDQHSIGEHGESENAIHVVWYVINSATGRWVNFEKKICETLFHDIPIIFILNKADISTQNDRNILRECVKDMKLKNNVGIYDVISTDNNINIIDIVFCSCCGSDDILIRKKHFQMQCIDCDRVESLVMDNGREKLVFGTYDILPSFVKCAFSTAQTVSFDLKEKHSLIIIKEFWDKWSKVHTVNKFLKVIAKMLAKISIIWDLKHSHQYGTFIAEDLLSTFTMTDKINLLFHTDVNKQKLHCTSLGVLWSMCLHDLNKLLFKKWIKIVDHCEDRIVCGCVKTILSQLNGSNLANIEDDIRNHGNTIHSYFNYKYPEYK